MGGDFRIGSCIVRLRRDCIESGEGFVHVKPKSMAVLECLARTPGQVVTRESLFNNVWPGSAVTDDVLTHCIMELRRAFGDSPKNPRYIETIPKVGFRLIPSIEPLNEIENDHVGESGPDTAPGASSVFGTGTRLSILIASTILLSMVAFWYLGGSGNIPETGGQDDVASVAVLPFVDMSEGGELGWYTRGLTDELINQIAQLDGLRVAAMTSSFLYADSDMDPREIGAALGVQHLLEGSVRTEGEWVLVTAQLISAADGFHVWSKQFEWPRSEILAVQQETARIVASFLSVQFQVGEPGTSPGSTASVEAYELYLQSRKLQWEASPDAMVQAIDKIKHAIRIDPEYAQAWYQLGGLYTNSSGTLSHVDGIDWLQLASEAFGQARLLEPQLEDLQFAMATVQYLRHDWAGVEETMDGGAGLELSTDFDLLFGWTAFLNHVGRIREAIPFHERKKRLIPASISTAIGLSRCYVIAGRIEEGLAEAERAWSLDGFKARAALNGLHIALGLNDRDLVLKWLERAQEQRPAWPLLGSMQETIDDRLTAQNLLQDAFDKAEAHDPTIASFAVFHGKPELALAAIMRSPSPYSFWGVDMKPIRSLPGFTDAVRAVGLEDYFREFGWNDFCRPLGADDFECQ